ncbi:MAG: uracil-DNA glycosylase, partial [Candidatus Binatia bacterium]
MQSDLDRLNGEIVACRKCPRLVRWREACGKEPPRRYRGMDYWARPLPGFGAPQARLLIVGLAPAAHGGNRTGRMFTGDRSGDWLYGALYKAGFANQAISNHRADGLTLSDCYITAAVHCAPPANKPDPVEFKRCRPYLVQELRFFKNLRAVIVLGKIAFDSFITAHRENG